MNERFIQSPMYISSEIDLLIIIAISSTGVFINGKLLKINEEDEKENGAGSIVNPVMSLYTKTMMILQPLFSFLFWLVHQEIDVPTWLQQLSCYEQYNAAVNRLYFAFNSLIIAAMRYTFIVQHEKVMVFGKERMKTIFYHSSYGIPIALGILHAFFIPTPQNAQNPIHSLCKHYYDQVLNITCGDSSDIQDQCSPILMMTNHYVPVEVIRTIKVMVTIMAGLVFSNVLEGILYWKTFYSIKR